MSVSRTIDKAIRAMDEQLQLSAIEKKLSEVGIYKRDAKAYVKIYNELSDKSKFIEEAHSMGYSKPEARLFLETIR